MRRVGTEARSGRDEKSPLDTISEKAGQAAFVETISHVEKQKPNHFVTAFRQAAGLYPEIVKEPWRDSLKKGVS